VAWPGEAERFPAWLNVVMYDGRFFWAVGNHGLVVNTDWLQEFVNNWTKPTSGNWQENFWSLGSLPAFWNDTVTVSNAGWKAVAIDASTVANYPTTLNLKAVTVAAPVDSQNLLLLNWAGYSLPLQIDHR